MDIHDRPYQVPRDPNYMRHAGRQGNNDECGGCCVRMGASNEGMGEGSRTGVWWTGVSRFPPFSSMVVMKNKPFLNKAFLKCLV